MRATQRGRNGAGLATVEFAMILPVLVLLALPVADFGRAIQANLVLINMTREGASLASRSSLPIGESQPYQQIMDSLAATAVPFDMAAQGTIYVTKIQGHLDKGVVRNVVVEQYRWARGWHRSAYAPASAVWSCGTGGTSWATSGTNDGSCRGLPSAGPASPVAAIMTGQLADDEVIFAVEGFYRFNMLFGGLDMGFGKLPAIGSTLESIAIF